MGQCSEIAGAMMLSELEEKFAEKDIQQILKYALRERERAVINYRFGLINGHKRTFADIGKKFSVSKERIRQIQNKALRRLRHYAYHIEINETSPL